ncbi:MAG TPA: cytidylate kinase-like family protein [Dehalococcoidia bacterium]|jgi:cytidylate kinase
MPVSVVTFSVQQGSDGHRIAQLVSQKLGFPYYDAEIVSQAAAIAGVSPETVAAAERWPTFIERMLERLALTTVVSEGVLPAPPSTNPSTLMMTSSDYRQIIEQVVANLAERGNCVIVGHASQVILKKVPGVFKALVTGSVQMRAERIATEQSLTLKDALAFIKDSDRQRIDFFKHVYNVDWLDTSLYDLSMNTDALDIETAVSMTMTAIENTA